jgi:hypothetical protein
MKKLMAMAALICAALVLAPLAGASNGKNEAKKLTAQQCKAEKKADKQAFKASHGKRAMRTCKRSGLSEQREELRNAAQECRTLRDEDRDGFRDTYGDNRNGENAFGKCVSSKAKAKNREDVRTFRNAAQECRALRAEDRDGFRDTYGNNRNGKNALGKCVSSKVKEASSDDGSEGEGGADAS